MSHAVSAPLRNVDPNAHSTCVSARSLEAERVHYVPLGIHCPDSSPTPKASGRFTIGYLARVSPEKGLSDLADAFVMLRRASRDCELRAAGYLPPSERSYLNDIRRRLDNSGVGDRFEYIGEVDRAGKQDFLGIFEYVGNETRGNNWNLQTVILYEDAAGDTQVIAFPYTGQSNRDGSQIFQHLSIQPAGPVDLMPGGVMLTRPGVVSYRNNEPRTLYYFQGGQWSRAFYNIDD